ncbi:DUF2663 family protein [Calidifontibacillus oryziterrae]|uniref:DUF2663 family protein n=1 Tax=Calidifontibacillus oryziterrae TaxID=1191699 RepID=UPI00035D91D8|nr:DUF2663 family protein [Calidifontibacillus oryziterrae]
MENPNMDEVGKIMINDLQKLKLKLTKKERELKIFNLLYIASATLLLAYITIFTIVPNWNQYNLLISQLINNVNHYFLILIVVTTHFRINALKQKSEKAEQEYHSLRCEMIQRAEELWPEGERWQNRHIFFQEMREKYDINLYYENPK